MNKSMTLNYAQYESTITDQFRINTKLVSVSFPATIYGNVKKVDFNV